MQSSRFTHFPLFSFPMAKLRHPKSSPCKFPRQQREKTFFIPQKCVSWGKTRRVWTWISLLFPPTPLCEMFISTLKDLFSNLSIVGFSITCFSICCHHILFFQLIEIHPEMAFMRVTSSTNFMMGNAEIWIQSIMDSGRGHDRINQWNLISTSKPSKSEVWSQSWRKIKTNDGLGRASPELVWSWPREGSLVAFCPRVAPRLDSSAATVELHHQHALNHNHFLSSLFNSCANCL